MRTLFSADPTGRVDSNNSSTTPLGAGATFTGGWTDVSGAHSTMIAVFADADGSFALQYSPDASNVDSTLTRYYRTGEINPPHRFTNTRQFMRIVYTNGSSAQSVFRLQSMVGDYGNLNAPLDGTLANDFDATVVRPTRYGDEVVLGLRQGHAANLKFGFNEDVDAAAPEVIAAFGGTFTPLSSAETLDVVSDNTNDTSAGTGARTLLITGIDANRDLQTEIVTMNGTTTVTTSNTWLGVNRIVVLSVGTSQGANIGTISVTATTAGTNQASIPPDKGVTQQMIFFTRAGHNGLINRVFANVLKLSGGASPRVNILLKVWNPGVTDTTYEVRRFRVDAATDTSVRRDFDPPLLLNPTDVAWLEAETDTNNTIIEAEFDLIEVKQAAA